jgi:hypothetical protein
MYIKNVNMVNKNTFVKTVAEKVIVNMVNYDITVMNVALLNVNMVNKNIIAKIVVEKVIVNIIEIKKIVYYAKVV